MGLNSTSLIVVPLIVLLVLTAASVSGLGNTDINQRFYAYQNGIDSLGNVMTLNDVDGNPICYYNGTSVYGTSGYVIAYEADSYPPQEAAWHNATRDYQLYYDNVAGNYGSESEPVFYHEFTSGVAHYPEDRMGADWHNLKPFNLSDSWGWLALLAVIVAIISIVGFKVVSSGESETSIQLILKSTFFITVWATLSVVTYPLILQGGFMVFILYFGMTLCYTVGIILSVGGGGGGD